MRILIVSQGLPFPIYKDGLTIRVFHLLQEFTKRANCHLIAFGDYNLTDKETRRLCSMTTYDIVSHQSVNGLFGVMRKAISGRRYYSIEFRRKIQQAIREFKPDVIFAEQSFMAQYADLFKGIPNVMSAVDAISLAALRQAKINKSRWRALPWLYVARQRLALEKKYFPMFDRVTVVGEYDADFLRKNLNHDISVIPNGVDTDFFTPKLLAPERNTILYSGNLAAPMNEEACIYLLREVFPIVHSKYPTLQLVIAGRDATAQILAALPSYVTLKRDIDDMRDAMRDALLYVSPIAYGTGIKNNVLQAMAMGIPVITTKLIADPIGIRNGETGVIAKRGPNFAAAIFDALDNRESLDRLGNMGRRHIEENFSWPNVATSYFNLFTELVNQQPRQPR